MKATGCTSSTYKWHLPVALLLAGQALSLIGSSIVQYAIVWYLVMRTDSGIVLTIVMLCGALPQAIISLFGGVWADRFNRKMLIILPDAIIAVATIILAFTISVSEGSLALFFVVLAIRSAGAGVQTPAVQAFIPKITPEEKLLRINSINGTIQSLNMIAAPAIAAVLVNVMPLWGILFIDVSTAAVGIICVALIRVHHTRVHEIKSASSVFTDMRAGLQYAWRFPRIKVVLLGYAIVSFINIAPMNLTLILMNRGFEGQTLDLGFTVISSASQKLAANEMAWSIGMVLGSAVLAICAKSLTNILRVLAIATICLGVTVAGLGIVPTLLLYMIIDACVGVSTAFTSSPTYTLIQEEVDTDMQGRVFGLLSTFAGFGAPLGMLVFGPLADVVPVQSIFILGGLLTIPVGLWIMSVNRKYPAQAIAS